MEFGADVEMKKITGLAEEFLQKHSG